MRDKQIEGMAKVLCLDCAKSEPCPLATSERMCNPVWQQAETLYNAGYRKASDVAEEIFAEIDDILNDIDYLGVLDFEELKKKYTESENNDGD